MQLVSSGQPGEVRVRQEVAENAGFSGTIVGEIFAVARRGATPGVASSAEIVCFVQEQVVERIFFDYCAVGVEQVRVVARLKFEQNGQYCLK